MILPIQKRNVLFIGFFVIAIMSSFPPWVGRNRSSEARLGYHFIAKPPDPNDGHPTYRRQYEAVGIEIGRLGFQYVAAICLTAAAWTVAQPNMKHTS